MKVYNDRFNALEEFSITENDDIFQKILEHRQDATDKYRFFLKFISQTDLAHYDLSSPNSIEKFRNICYTIDSPLMPMGGCNMAPGYYNKDNIRYAGIKISDPYGKIFGTFDIRDGIITYSPIFPRFYEERDLVKFANDEYFTTMTFEDIMKEQITRAVEFYVHTRNCYSLKDLHKYGPYRLEKVSQEQMLEFLYNPEEGTRVLKKHLKRK